MPVALVSTSPCRCRWHPRSSNDAATKVAKIIVTETAELNAVKAARQDKPKAGNDNTSFLTSAEAADVLEVSTHTLRKWVREGCPVIGRVRKKRNELNVRQISGHLRFEAASVHALADKIKADGLK